MAYFDPYILVVTRADVMYLAQWLVFGVLPLLLGLWGLRRLLRRLSLPVAFGSSLTVAAQGIICVDAQGEQHFRPWTDVELVKPEGRRWILIEFSDSESLRIRTPAKDRGRLVFVMQKLARGEPMPPQAADTLSGTAARPGTPSGGQC